MDVELSRRVGRLMNTPPILRQDDAERREFVDAVSTAASFDELPARWQEAILSAEATRQKAEEEAND